MKTTIRKFSLNVIASILLLIFFSCEKEQEVVNPADTKPDKVVVTVSKRIIMSGRRDSALWNVQLYKGGKAFDKAYAVSFLTDLGFFLENGAKTKRISVPTDAAGKGSLYFYGNAEPGFAIIRVWGDGFGVDTVRTSIIMGHPCYMKLAFRDPLTSTWKETDSLIRGAYRSRNDSMVVRATVLDSAMQPVKGARVDLLALINGARGFMAMYGYFATSQNIDSTSDGRTYTDSQGNATDLFYADAFPVSGKSNVLIVARVDSAVYGRIEIGKNIVISAP